MQWNFKINKITIISIKIKNVIDKLIKWKSFQWRKMNKTSIMIKSTNKKIQWNLKMNKITIISV